MFNLIILIAIVWLIVKAIEKKDVQKIQAQVQTIKSNGITYKLLLGLEIVLIISVWINLIMTSISGGPGHNLNLLYSYLHILLIAPVVLISFFVVLKIIDPVGFKESLNNKNIRILFVLLIFVLFFSLLGTVPFNT